MEAFGPRVESVPAVPYKFLDIGTRMGEHHLEDLILMKSNVDNILHPRHDRPGIPSVHTFHSVVKDRVGTQPNVIQHWCDEKAWFESSPTRDFWVTDAPKYRWGLPVIVPTCPKKMFKQGPRLKYFLVSSPQGLCKKKVGPSFFGNPVGFLKIVS